MIPNVAGKKRRKKTKKKKKKKKKIGDDPLIYSVRERTLSLSIVSSSNINPSESARHETAQMKKKKK